MESKTVESVKTVIAALQAPGAKQMLGHRLRIVRLLRGMSAVAVARRVGMSHPNLTYMEQGRQMPIDRMLDLCDVYGVDWGELVSAPAGSVELFGVPVDNVEEVEHVAA